MGTPSNTVEAIRGELSSKETDHTDNNLQITAETSSG